MDIYRNVGCAVGPPFFQVLLHVPHLHYKYLVLHLLSSPVSTPLFSPPVFSETCDLLQSVYRAYL